MIKIFKKNPSDYFLLLILITLPFGGRAFNSIAVIVFIFYSLYNLLLRKEKLKFNKLSISFQALFVLGLLSLIWSENPVLTSEAIIRFLPYLVLSVIVVFKYRIQFILNLFSKSIVYLSLFCLLKGIIKSFQHSDINFLFYHELSTNLGDLNAIYMSVFVSFAILFFLYKKEKNKIDLFQLSFLFVFLILLSSKMIITITLLNCLLFFIIKKRLFRFKEKYFILFFFFIALGLSSFKLIDRLKVEFEKTKINEVLNKKDFGNVYLWTGTGLRAFQTKLFFEILSENKAYILGLGLNNSQKSLDQKYKEYNLYPGYYGYNYHNQYLQTFSELGFVGVILIAYIFYLIFYNAYVNKDYFLFSFSLLIVFICITESLLWRQRGMVFFITISLLLYNNKERVF